MSFLQSVWRVIRELFLPNRRYSPSYVYFDHLYREYEANKAALPPTAKGVTDTFEKMARIRRGEPATADTQELAGQRKLTWHDVYECELVLLPYLTLEDLRTKAAILRERYLSLVGEKKYQKYLSSEPPTLATATRDTLLPDVSFLVKEICFRFVALAANSKAIKRLTFWVGLVLFGVLAAVVWNAWPDCQGKDCSLGNRITIIAVIMAGALGAVMSIIQRLGSVPADSDPIINLAALWNNNAYVIVSPLTGAFFALLVSLLFTSEVLTGRFFPQMVTSSGQGNCILAAQPTPAPTPAASPPPTPEPDADATPSPSPSPSPLASPSASPAPSPSPGEKEKTPVKATNMRQFIECTGPKAGPDFALLLVWCFLAGFAERLVPDALSRLIETTDSLRR